MLLVNWFLFLFAHLLKSITVLLRFNGSKRVIAENLLLKHQLLILNRGRKRAPRISLSHRLVLGFWCSFLSARRIRRCSIGFRPSSLFRFHHLLTNLKYRFLFSSKKPSKPGPRGPSAELIAAIVEFKRRNPRCGCPRIAQQISHAFGVEIDKDVVRRVLASHYKPLPGDDGPSWLTFLGHSADSLWSLDLFRTESVLLKSHWVLVGMDQFSRRIIGFSVHPTDVDGPSLCRMFNQIISGEDLPRHLSFDQAPLFDFAQWKANLRILQINPIRTLPNVPVSHPFIERLIGTVRREYLDRLFYWTGADLQRKLQSFQSYYNELRVHQGIQGGAPNDKTVGRTSPAARLNHFAWKSPCNGLFHMPIAA